MRKIFNKKLLLIIPVIIVITIFLFDLIKPKKESEQLPQTSVENIVPQPTSQIVLPDETLLKESETEREKYQSSFPIYIKDYKTSSGITTDINVFIGKYDPVYNIRLEIYRINYDTYVADDSNPNYTAFVESFSYVKEEMKKKGIDPDKFYYKFYSKENIHYIAEKWARNAKLINY
jgi:hypothetical protein